MFGLSEATELFQGSTERTWNCVLHFFYSVWSKLYHFRRPIMPKSRKRHHSRSRSRSHSRDRSRERDEKHKKIDLHDKDRDGKRRKIDSDESPHYKRSVSSEPEINESRISSITDSEDANGITDIIELKSTNSTENIEKTDLPDDNDEDDDDDKVPTLKLETDATIENKDAKENVIEEKTTATNITTADNFTVAVLDNTSEKVEPSLEGSTDNKTPKKNLTPKRLQKKLDSEKKRDERQKAKEEKERKKNEEKERIKQEKLKKQKEKEHKEELKRKEREEKEELRKKEREEKEQKRKEKEEKDEQKKKEREQEKLKKQQEIEEKNKEKQKEEVMKQKASAVFVNFFVAKKNEVSQEERKNEIPQEEKNNCVFKAFEVKSDMKLPPARRKPLTESDIEKIDKCIKEQDESVSYLKELKSFSNVRSCPKTWPYEECVDDDVTIIEESSNLGETIYEDKARLQKFRAKFLKFHENRRPAYYGTWRKKSTFVIPRKPFSEDKDVFNYDEDSDDDWEEEEQGESLNGSDDEADKEIEDEKDDYEVDNEFFVPHGHLSDDEIDDEEKSRLSPESLKQKLKLLKDAFDEDMQSKTHKLKPRSIGCIWYKKDGSNVDEAIDRYLQPLAVLSNGEIFIKNRTEINLLSSARKAKPLQELNSDYIPIFIKVIHGNQNNKRVIIEQFITYMANTGVTIDVKKIVLVRKLQELARWEKYKENGPLKNKFGWFVSKDLAAKYNVILELPNILDNDKN